MSCFLYELSIHSKDCPDKLLRYKISTNKDTYEVDTLEELMQIIEQDSKE